MKNINGYNITRIDIHKYSNNGNLALELICMSEYGEEPFAIISVNLEEVLMPNFTYIDTNNCDWVEKFIKDNELGTSTGITRQSGWCEYPLYEFNLDKIEEYNNGNI